MSRKQRKDLSEMNFFDHLDDLRAAIFRGLGGLFIGLVIGYYFSSRIQGLLTLPFEELSDASLAILAPAEGFLVQLKISLVAGIFISAPWMFYQLWRFVAPGLFKHERKMVFPVVFFSSTLFLVGAAFGVWILPMATSFFLSFAQQGIVNVWSLGRYVDFVLRMLLAFGIVFELPLLIYFLARFGVVTPSFLRTYRRHMYVVFLVGAALITPPDVFTQVVMAVPLVTLYEGSILLAVVARRKWESRADDREEEEEEAEQEPEAPAETKQDDPEAGKPNWARDKPLTADDLDGEE
ncbi:twin-arginine translocase subunit TatC [bacterium]|nr:twin-arginine translocase subunit TatC [bacterium]